MNNLFSRLFQAGLVCVVLLVGLGLSGCQHSRVGGSLTSTRPASLPSGELAFVSRCCECDAAGIQVLCLPCQATTPTLSGQNDAREPAWSPDGQMLGMLFYDISQRTLHVIDLPTRTVRLEVPGDIDQFAWSADGQSLFYLDAGSLQCHSTTKPSRSIADGVSGFSVSPNGWWLGLSIRDPAQDGYFTFRVLDLDSGRLLATADHSDMGCYGINHSVWSPAGTGVAVVFGLSSAQESKVVIYAVHEDHLHIKASVIARETYQRDYGEDLNSVEFGDLAWSPDGQKLLVIRYVSDTHPGGEVLLFDKDLSNYQRLPLGEVRQLTWMMDKWLVYTKSSPREGSRDCKNPFLGEIWLADMETFETQRLVTDVMYIYQPVWRPPLPSVHE